MKRKIEVTVGNKRRQRAVVDPVYVEAAHVRNKQADVPRSGVD